MIMLPRFLVAFFIAFASVGAAVAQPVQRELRVFPIELIEAEHAPTGPLPVAPRLRMGNVWALGDHCGFFEIDFEESDERPPTRVGELSELVERFVEPDSWSNARNSFALSGERAVVVQTVESLEKVRALLAALEDHAARRFAVELLLVPRRALDAVASDWAKPTSPPWLPPKVFDDLARGTVEGVADFTSELVYLAARAPEGAACRFAPRRRATLLADHDVNQTGVVPVIQPVLNSVASGSYGEVRVLASPRAGWVRCDITLGALATDTGQRTRLPRGEIELAATRHERLSAALFAPLDQAIVVGAFEDTSDDAVRSFVALARIRRLFEHEGAETALTDELVLYECGALTAPWIHDQGLVSIEGSGDEDYYSIAFDEEEDDEEKRPAPLSARVLENAIEQIVGEQDARLHFGDDARCVLFGGSTARREALESLLDGLSPANLRPVSVSIWQGSVEDSLLASAATGGAILGDEALALFERRDSLSVRTVSIAGAIANVAAVKTRRYVADIERVSGGTGHTIVEVADPVVAMTGSGLLLSVQASLVPGTDWAQLRVQGERARPPAFGRKSKVRASLRMDVEGEGASARLEALGEEIEIELPIEDTSSWRHFVTVPLGKPILLNALPDPERPGRSRALIAVVNAFSAQTTE